MVDSREQMPYGFDQAYDNVIANRSPRLVVPVVRKALATGDYSLLNYEDLITLERKSKADLYGSISQGRENFEGRLERMETFAFAAVVVESGWDDLLACPPPFTEFSPKSLSRTIQSWMIRYRTHWLMMPSRVYAEAITFRLLQRFWLHQQEAIRNE